MGERRVVRKRRASAPWARGVRGVVEVRKGAGRVCEGGGGGGGAAGGLLAVGGGEGMVVWWCGGGGGCVTMRDVVRAVGGLIWVIVGCGVVMGVELLSACAWCWRASAG